MTLDSSQQAILDACVRPCALSVIGAAGSGKSTVLRLLAESLLRDNPSARIAVLSPDRRAATDLRNSISLEVGALGEGVVVQSVTAFAFSIVSAHAQAVGRAEPELISGPDQDVVLKEIFDLAADGVIPGIFPLQFGPEQDNGHAQDENGEGGRAANEHDRSMADLPAFRAEFRDLITRAAELGLESSELAALGNEHGQPMWVKGARVLDAYENSLALEAADTNRGADRVDHARLITQATSMLRQWDVVSVRTPGGELDIQKPAWDWVLVDDVHNATLALRDLLRQLQVDGASIVTFGDPDLAVQGFRGGVAHLPALLTRDADNGGIGAQRHILERRYRGSALERTVRRVTDAIHTAGSGRHRGAKFVENQGLAELVPVKALAFRNSDEELGWVATHLRRLHLKQGIPYSQMAVITRSQSDHQLIRHTLVRLGVPVAQIGSAKPLREQSAVASLVEIIRLALVPPDEVTDSRLTEVLTGRLIGIDPLELRRIVRELHGWELATGGQRMRGELLRDVLRPNQSQGIKEIPQLARAHYVINRIRESVSGDALAEGVLWAAWDALGLAESWQQVAFGHGAEADEANRNLDAIIQLFRVAQRIADQNQRNASIDVLFEHLEQQDLPEDTIARTGSGTDEVTLATPTATIGRSWEHVVIASLNDGTWPNTRLRNPLTQVPALAATVVGALVGTPELSKESDARDVIDDELRMLLQAVTRADVSVVFTCLNSEDVLPSRFLDYLMRDGLELDESQHGQATLDEDGLVGQLRQVERTGHGRVAIAATALLDKLATDGVASANRALWVDKLEISGSMAPGKVSLSPSSVESILKCPTRAFLQRINAQDMDDTTAAHVGRVIHALAEAHPDGDEPAIRELFDQLWSSLDLKDDFEGARQRQKAQRMVDHLIGYLQDHKGETDVELSAHGEINGIPIRARLDRVERDSQHPEKVTIVDFKTGKVIPRVADMPEHPQLLIYQWLVSRGEVIVPDGALPVTKSLGAKLISVGTNNKTASERFQPEIGASGLERAEELIVSAAADQQGPHFEVRKNDSCRSCAYTSICPIQEGKRVFS